MGSCKVWRRPHQDEVFRPRRGEVAAMTESLQQTLACSHPLELHEMRNGNNAEGWFRGTRVHPGCEGGSFPSSINIPSHFYNSFISAFSLLFPFPLKEGESTFLFLAEARVQTGGIPSWTCRTKTDFCCGLACWQPHSQPSGLF